LGVADYILIHGIKVKRSSNIILFLSLLIPILSIADSKIEEIVIDENIEYIYIYICAEVINSLKLIKLKYLHTRR
jgi:hypothetical protein